MHGRRGRAHDLDDGHGDQEQLKSRDDDARAIAYSIVEGPVPVDSHLATITVHDGDDPAARVTWQVDIEPGGRGDVQDIYQGALGALKEKVETGA